MTPTPTATATATATATEPVAADAAPSAITLTGVTKTYSAALPAALQGVNLDILPGTSTAIVGPSGSGKSTILRIIAGLEDANGGRVRLAGRDVTALLPEERGIAMVFQRPLLFPHLTVLDNVAFADRAAGLSRAQARDRAREHLELVHMAEFGGRSPHSLSGGQQQRVAVARALAAKPSVLLLDEPFSALDPGLKDDMHAMIAEIRQAVNPTILFVTHDRDEASAMAERIVVLENGQLLQHDSVDHVFHRPASLAVARLLGGKNAFAGTIENGVHRSALGDVALDGDVASGPATLVFRHEAVTSTLRQPTSGADADALATRHADAAACQRFGPRELHGVVTSTVQRGPRREVIVQVADAEVYTEAAPGHPLSVGDLVTVSLPCEALWAVPAS
ncbi:putative spermidine/putrescine transport system ATP-binding protein [Salinibacterium amurskyense]|uniref:ABC-type quaternary amine transporter n=1 Tax=Salinibacterium amurskyense TaxID=205941 RepID=A0A2M9D658_9MICO|nr:ABC transporter ATP-binding protein [Salinibacterium amurskyense]PJJ81182.1 putative spermidine/putrescine transport system ATP-binding protein [Salinibacterium amurskyense]RLQ83204.1 ABC transporter ATP-binding protein [Salinibacterium amurskyense]GHD81397.1 ABC transporter ATP-binding protein [Salinibacterium amurskyense]